VLVDRGLPRKEFIDRKHIAAAGFLKGEQATTHGRNHLGLAPDDPAFRTRRRQIRHRQWAAIRADHVFGPRSKGDCHENSHADNLTTHHNATRIRLKITYVHRTKFKYENADVLTPSWPWRLGLNLGFAPAAD